MHVNTYMFGVLGFQVQFYGSAVPSVLIYMILFAII